LHQNGVVHRDLKPENMLFVSPDLDAEIKIADFGLAKMRLMGGDDAPDENLGGLRTPCGSPAYVAPEVLMRTEYDKGVDMWSMGVILYVLLSGCPPFDDECTPKMYESIKLGDWSFPSPEWGGITDSAKDLVSRLLTVNPRDRATADQAMAHPWLRAGIVHNAAEPSALAPDALLMLPDTPLMSPGVMKKQLGKINFQLAVAAASQHNYHGRPLGC
jgi:calcium/calmodulin-dependent protein kinase I